MKKRRRGRPTLPPEYWRDLVSLGEYSKHVPQGLTNRYDGWDIRSIPRLGLSGACQLYMKNGAYLRWTRNGATVAKISDWKTLRSRIIEARRRLEATMPKLTPLPQREDAKTLKWKLPPRSTVLWWVTNKGKLPIRAGVEILYQPKPQTSELVTRSLHEK